MPWTLVLTAYMLATQFAIALVGGELTKLVGGLTAVAAIGIVIWLWRKRSQLAHVRFGFAMIHAIAFASITSAQSPRVAGTEALMRQQ